ncbi:hypothetical protein HAX54_019563, partial [Datura stramonium]|nr:hypothetical protein [Datura stramonium]
VAMDQVAMPLVSRDVAPLNFLTECEAHGKTSLPLRLVPKKDRHHTLSALEVENVGYDRFPHRTLSLNHFHIPPTNHSVDFWVPRAIRASLQVHKGLGG